MSKKLLTVSICIPAYNEGKNIEQILVALLAQETKLIKINSIVVVSSASTDNTNEIVEKYIASNPSIQLIKQEKRMGKAIAINEFLKQTKDEIVVIESADTVPYKDCIENLCVPFLKDKKIGMTGGAPYPINDPNTFLGYIIHAWWWFHRNIPRFGEIIAYRNVLDHIRPTTAVDEAYIQAKMIQMGYKVVFVESAIVNNKGAENVKDLIIQRRRVMNGHARLFNREHVKIDNMTKSSLRLLLFHYNINSFKELCWLIGGIAIEVYARFLGAYDCYIKKTNPFVWDIASSTKDFAMEPVENISEESEVEINDRISQLSPN